MQQLSGNTGRVQDHEERISQPKNREQHLFLNLVQGVEEISRDLNQGPGEDHQVQRPVGLRGRALPGDEDQEQAAEDLEYGGDNGGANQAQHSVHNFKKGQRLNNGQGVLNNRVELCRRESSQQAFRMLDFVGKIDHTCYSEVKDVSPSCKRPQIKEDEVR